MNKNPIITNVIRHALMHRFVTLPWSTYEEMVDFYTKYHPAIFDAYVELGIFPNNKKL